MTEIKDMNIEQVEQRMTEIDAELETAEDLDALKEEVRSLKERKEAIKAEAEEAKEERMKAVDEGITVKSFEEGEEKKMEKTEVRNMPEYLDAYKEYVMTGDDTECRKIMTDNGNLGTDDTAVPMPTLVHDEIKTAWEDDDIFSRMPKLQVKGNYKVAYEVSSTEAGIHEEGGEDLDEEVLQLGVAEILPMSIKKFITLTDEAIDSSVPDLLRYIYDELTYRIVKGARDWTVQMIAGNNSGIPQSTLQTALSVGTVAQALGLLSDRASEPVIICNKATWAELRAQALTASYGVDPFEGLPVCFCNALPAYGTASSGAVYMLVGDLRYGTLATLPNGEEVKVKVDDLSLADKDLVKVIGRMYVGLGLVAPYAFTLVKKA